MTQSFNTPKLPEVTFNKTGYEIRSDILGMAKDMMQNDYTAKMHGWEVTATKDSAGNIVSNVTMPEFPGVAQVLAAAEQMYKFVSSGVPKNK